MDNDQSFKNLILDYPRQALSFVAESEDQGLSSDVRITPIRQEQLNLPNMQHEKAQKVDVYARASQGLFRLALASAG